VATFDDTTKTLAFEAFEKLRDLIHDEEVNAAKRRPQKNWPCSFTD